jgi:hypothetical protein
MKNQISKANEQLFSLLSRANEINDYEVSSEYDTREKYICANIKVYECLNDDDVLKLIPTGTSEDNKQDILTEFTSNRLNGIYEHVCNTEVEYLKDFVGGCAHTNFNNAKRAFNENLQSECSLKLKFYHEHFKTQFEQFKTLPLFIQYLETTFTNEYKEFYYLQMLDSKNVWQFGRSGGWLSIAESTDLENFCEDSANLFYQLKDFYYADDNKQFNEALKDYSYSYENLEQTRKRLISETENEINCWNEKKEAIDWIISYIEEAKKAFKDSLRSQLEFEIDNFINDNFSIDNKIDSYLNGETNILNSIALIEHDTIKTNLGAKVTFEQAIKAIEDIKAGLNVIGQKVGVFTIEKIVTKNNKTFVKIGCHVFNLEDIENQLTQLA